MKGEGDRRDLLLEAGLALSAERSLPVILQRIVELATQVTRARYGAIGVLGADSGILEFVVTGITAEQRAAIGQLPVGKGILGALIGDARPLRLADLTRDPRSVGFPAHHPPMRSFLGVPVMAHGRVFGNLYLTEKQGAPEFDADDEQALVILAAQAGVAVENARLYQELEARVQRLDALHAIASAIVAGDDPDQVVGLVARQARALLGADLASVAVPSGGREQLTVRTADGSGTEELVGDSFPIQGSVSGEVILSGRVVALADAAVDQRVAQPVVRSGRWGPALFVPLAAGGEWFGTLLLARCRGGRRFDQGEVGLAEVFAGQAAVVLEQGRLQRQVRRLQMLEDRERIARELHDGTVQALFTVGLGLQGTASLVGEAEVAGRIQAAVEELDRVIADLRNYIFAPEPGVLADRQLGAALEEMVEEFQQRSRVVGANGLRTKTRGWCLPCWGWSSQTTGGIQCRRCAGRRNRCGTLPSNSPSRAMSSRRPPSAGCCGNTASACRPPPRPWRARSTGSGCPVPLHQRAGQAASGRPRAGHQRGRQEKGTARAVAQRRPGVAPERPADPGGGPQLLHRPAGPAGHPLRHL